jgi:membrane-associated phospholipid phosphatase
VYRHEVDYTWTKPPSVDAAFRNWVRADTAAGRQTAADVSDYTWHGSTYYVLLDGLVTPLASDRLNTDVAFQLTLLNWQAIGLTGVLVRLVHVSVGRARPSLQNCSSDPDAENHCEFRGASFVGGHAMMTSANAGLACANHHYLPLYGGGLADSLVCPVMVAAALTVGTARIVADRHWLTDTVPSWIVGGAIGFGMPYLLHYRYVRDVASPLPNTALLPWATQTSAGLDFVGQL